MAATPKPPRAGVGDAPTLAAPTLPGAFAPTVDGVSGKAAPVDDDVDTVAAGTVLRGRYEVREKIGAGGMGAVYSAYDRLIDSDVAIKFVHPALAADQRERNRLRSEVKLAQTVTHVNVARTYTLEEIDGHLFIVMERLRGRTLAARLRAGALPLEETLRISRGLLRGLQAAHERGVVHRDIKPANIILCDDDRVVLMDFGLARAGHAHEPAAAPFRAGALGSPHHTHTQLGGTPGYIAPELVGGGKGGARADLYSFGVVLYEMLTGKPPFVADTPLDLVMKHVEARVPDIGTTRPDTPEHVVAVVKRLLEKAPEKRFATADETRVTLDPRELGSSPSLGGLVIPSTPPTRPAPSAKRWLVAGSVVLALGGSIGFAVTRPERVREAPAAQPVMGHAVDAGVPAARAVFPDATVSAAVTAASAPDAGALATATPQAPVRAIVRRGKKITPVVKEPPPPPEDPGAAKRKRKLDLTE